MSLFNCCNLRYAIWMALILAFVHDTAHAQDVQRRAEIEQCLPGEISTWGDGRDRPAVSAPMVFVYDHTAAPAWFDEVLVLAALQRSAAAWSRCGVPGEVLTVAAAAGSSISGLSVSWSEARSAGTFGLANLSQRTLVLNPASFQLLKTRNPAHDARETLQMVISHEMGHLFGLVSHSRRCVDSTSNYDNGKGERCFARDPTLLRRFVEYRSSMPTACDIQRCRIANGLPVAQ